MKTMTLLGLAALTLNTVPASACSCAPPPPPRQALTKSAAVFTGKVKSIQQDGRRKTVTFEISRTWKGTKGKTVQVMTATNSAACGVNFQKGKSYLVYCYRPMQKGKPASALHTNICTRTATLAAAKGDLKEIGEGKQP